MKGEGKSGRGRRREGGGRGAIGDLRGNGGLGRLRGLEWLKG